MRKEKFIEQLEEEYPGIKYENQAVEDYLNECEADKIEPWTAMFAEYFAISY